MKKISTRTIVATTIPVVAFVVGILLILSSLGTVVGAALGLYEEDFLAMNSLIESDRDAYQSRLALLRLTLADIDGMDTSIDDVIGDVTENMQQVHDRFVRFQELAGLADDQPDVATFHTEYDTWTAETNAVIDAVRAGNGAEARRLYETGGYVDSFDRLRGSLDSLTATALQLGQNTYQKIARDAGRIRVTIIATAVVVLAAIGVLAFVVFWLVLSPLRRTTVIMREISSGEADLTQRLNLNREDEIGELTRHFDAFLESIATIVREVAAVSADTAEIKDQTAAEVEESTSAIEQIAANIRNMSSRAQILDESADKTANAVGSIGTALADLKEQINSQAALVEESTAAVVEMTASIQSVADVAARRLEALGGLDEAIRDGSGAVASTVDRVGRIANSIASIREITGVIQSISSQTNLLAMNAAIEAAHAGDAGRGFAVVASEIRGLAESTSTQSKSIKQLLGEVIAEIEAAASAGEMTSTTFGNVTEQVGGLKSALEEISASMDELRSGGSQINQAMTELQGVAVALSDRTGGIDEAQGNIAEQSDAVRRLAGEITNGLSEISVGASEIRQAMTQLNDSATTLSELITRLDGQIGRLVV